MGLVTHRLCDVVNHALQVISAITPRPIAFISSQDKDGVVNVSPYSYFNVMSHDPIHITIGERLHRLNGCCDAGHAFLHVCVIEGWRLGGVQ